jgi:hypothetical protein
MEKILSSIAHRRQTKTNLQNNPNGVFTGIVKLIFFGECSTEELLVGRPSEIEVCAESSYFFLPW